MDQADPKLRFDAGTHDDLLVSIIIFVQLILGAILVITVFGSFSLMSGFEFLLAAFSALIGIVVVMYLLNQLYE